MTVVEQMLLNITRIDQDAGATLILYPNYKSNSYDKRPSNITVVYPQWNRRTNEKWVCSPSSATVVYKEIERLVYNT